MVLAIAAALSLTGCSILGKVAEKGASLNDGALGTAIFTICNGASIGAIKRKFTWEGYLEVHNAFKCESKDKFTPPLVIKESSNE
jgi:hypothetical protein